MLSLLGEEGNTVTVYKRTLIFTTLLIVLLLLVILFVLKPFLLKSFIDLDHRKQEETLNLITNIIEADIDGLSVTNKDWAFWDDTYQFIQDKNEEYIQSNLPESTLDTNNLNFMIFVNDQGKTIYNYGYYTVKDKRIPLKETFIQEVTKYGRLTDFKTNKGQSNGLINTSKGLIMISSNKVLHSDLSGPPNGVLIMGRFVNRTLMNEWEKRSQLKLDIQPPPAGVTKANADNGPSVHALNEDYNIGNKTLFDINKKPIAQIEMVHKREIYSKGKESVTVAMGFIFLMAIITILTTLFILNKFLLSRIINIEKFVRRIQETQNLSSRIITSGNDEITNVGIGINHMLQSIEESQKKINYIAFHDHLTKLPNRLLFNNRLEEAEEEYKNNPDEIFSIFFIDLDRFKRINDTLGHPIGDELLELIAQRLVKMVNKQDTVARIGGDEFTVLLKSAKTLSKVKEQAQMIIETLSEPYDILGEKLYVTISLGISVYPLDSRRTKDLLIQADKAMFDAKKQGGKRYGLYTAPGNLSKWSVFDIERDLRNALVQNEFCIFYQPRINPFTNEIVAMEALIRWKHPVHGMIGPGEFIHIAEENGLIHDIGRWVLLEACEQVKKWMDDGLGYYNLSVNVSKVQFQNENLVDDIDFILEKTNFPAEYLEIEITESITPHDLEYISTVLNQLKARKIKIAIDDFGQGTSNLMSFRKMPLDIIKIDRSFVVDFDKGPYDAAIIIAILKMAEDLNLHVIAEGVETFLQLSFLMEHGCKEIQGYFYSKPLPVNEMEVYIEQRSFVR